MGSNERRGALVEARGACVAMLAAAVLSAGCEHDGSLPVNHEPDAAVDVGDGGAAPCRSPKARAPIEPALVHFADSLRHDGAETLWPLRAVDLDGDGKLDVVGAGTSAFAWLKGNGDGTFAPTVVVPDASGISMAVATGDFNADGKLDVVILEGRVDQTLPLAVWLGRGGGAFVEGPRTPTLNATPPDDLRDLLVADWNGDGKLDVVAGGGSANGALVVAYLGNGDGSFRPSTPLLLEGGEWAASLAAGDVNGDGRLDVVVGTNTPSTPVLLSRGDGTFIRAGSALTDGNVPLLLADWSGDGKLDLLTGPDLYLGRGDGTFGDPTSTSLFRLRDLAAVDLDRDGHLDIAARTTYDEVSLVRGDGAGHFTPPVNLAAGGWSKGFVAGDWNGDGHPDFAVSHASPDRTATPQLTVLLGDGRGGAGGARVGFAVTDPVMGLLAGDHDRDGWIDIVDVRRSSLVVWSGKAGPFTTPVGSQTLLNAWAATQGDWNGDGNLDVAAVLLSESRVGTYGAVTIVRGDGKGALNTTQTLRSGNGLGVGYRDIAAADLDGDGDLDLVVAHDGAYVQVLPNQGGAFVEGDSYSVGHAPTSIAIADLTGDGKLDIAAAVYDDDPKTMGVAIAAGRGDGHFDAPTLMRIGNQPHHVAAGDLDGDGRADLVLSDRESVSVYVVDCHGRLARAASYPLVARTTTIADVNHDGLPDLALALSSEWTPESEIVYFGCNFLCPDRGTGLLLGRGDGSFTGLQTWPTGAGARQVIAADLDGDGWPELVTAHAGSQIVTVLSNLH